jgi:hypothetical protein
MGLIRLGIWSKEKTMERDENDIYVLPLNRRIEEAC